MLGSPSRSLAQATTPENAQHSSAWRIGAQRRLPIAAAARRRRQRALRGFLARLTLPVERRSARDVEGRQCSLRRNWGHRRRPARCSYSCELASDPRRTVGSAKMRIRRIAILLSAALGRRLCRDRQQSDEGVRRTLGCLEATAASCVRASTRWCGCCSSAAGASSSGVGQPGGMRLGPKLPLMMKLPPSRAATEARAAPKLSGRTRSRRRSWSFSDERARHASQNTALSHRL